MYFALWGPCTVSGETVRKKVLTGPTPSEVSPGPVADGLTATRPAPE